LNNFLLHLVSISLIFFNSESKSILLKKCDIGPFPGKNISSGHFLLTLYSLNVLKL